MKYKSWFMRITTFAICFIILTFSSKGQAEGVVETNWTIVGQIDGSLRINWSAPQIKPSNESGQSSVFHADKYILQWSFINARNETVGANVTTIDANATITNAYFGATYVLVLYCQMENVIVMCKNQTIIAYPSCPSNWRQHLTSCYYFSKEEKSWSDSKVACDMISSGRVSTTAVSDEELRQFIQQQSRIWTVMDPCTQLSSVNVSSHNCCSSTTDLSQPFITCPAEQKWPFVCQIDAPAITAKIANISLFSLTNNSVVVFWSEINSGWNLLWRTLTVYNKIGDLLSITTVPNANMRATLSPLKPGEKYNLKFWPHKDGKVQSDAHTSFALLNPRSSSETNGGVLQLPLSLEAIVHWDGVVRLQWTPAKVMKDNTIPFYADTYRLSYGLVNENRSNYIEINETINNYYDVDDLHVNKTYKIYLNCTFGRNDSVPCQRLPAFTINLPTKIIYDEGKYEIYDVQNKSDLGRSWADAESVCTQQNGHLVSITSKTDNENVKTLIAAGKTFWIGAENCDNSGDPKWSDGTRWSYDGGLTAQTPNGRVCCLSSTFVSSPTLDSSWNYTDCNATLPYVCQSTVKDLGILHNFSVILSTFASFQIQWKTSNHLLTVDYYTAESCNVNASICKLMVTNVTSPPIYVRSLQTDTQYLIRVNATLKNLSYVISVNATATTGKMFEVMVNVTDKGKVKFQWPNINVDGKGAIVYVISPDDDQNDPKFLLKIAITSNVNKTSISGLPYGNSYHLKLNVIVNGTGEVIQSIPFKLITKPNCTRDEFQFESSCFWIGKTDVTWDEGNKVCREANAEMALTSSQEKIRYLGRIAEMADTPLWVEGKTSAFLRKSPDKTEVILHERVKRSTGCRVIWDFGENNEEISGVEQCVKRYPVLCERRLKVQLDEISNLTIKDVTTTAITLQWSCSSWKPSNYNITVNPVAGSNQRVKRADPVQPAIALGNDIVTITNLQPNTEYKIDVTPSMIATGQTPNSIMGKTSSINVHTLDPNSTATPRALEMTAGQMDTTSALTSGNGSANDDGNSVRNDQLQVFRIISCSCIIALVTLSIIIFVSCSMMRFRDCLCEVCFEISLLVAHILILVDVHTDTQIDCRVTANCIHYFFTTCFLFFALECLCHVKTMTKIVPIGFLCHGWQLFLVGWGIPIIIIIITSTTIGDQYVLKDNIERYCWLNMDGDALLATIIPIGIFAGLAFLFIFIAICGRPDENYEVDEESFMRYEPMQDLRWMLLFIFGLLVSHWAIGMVATHNLDGNLHIAFIVLTIILGIAILMLRCIGDDEIRLRIRNCCKGSSIEPVDKGKYLGSQPNLRRTKGVFHAAGPDMDGTLIIKRTYIYRP